MASGDILIRWASESGQAIRDMGRVEKALKTNMTAAEKWGRRWQTASKVMRTAGVAALGAIATEAVRAGKAAAEQEQAVGGLAAVFKRSAPGMERWARSMSEYGLSMTDASTYAAQLGASLKGAGIPMKESADLTQRLVELGGDLAATFGGTTSDAVAALGSTLRGEYDPLERYGAALKESEVNALLAKTGQDKLTGAALEQAKMAARLKLIWKKTQDAQGQAGREADTSAAAFQRLKAKLANIEADLGKALLPFMEDLAAAVEKLVNAAEKNPDAVKRVAVGVTALAASMVALSYAANGVTVLKGTAAALSKFPKAGALTILAVEIVALQQALKDVDENSEPALQSLQSFWNWDPGKGLARWQTVGDFFRGLPDLIRGALPGMRTLGLAVATVTDALGLTENQYEKVLRTFDNPVEIKAANDQALAAADQVQDVLDALGKSKPQAQIRAANRQALEAARTAEQAIKDATARREATIDANTALARAEVIAWKAWAEAQQALMTVTARVKLVGGGVGVGADAQALALPAHTRTPQLTTPAGNTYNITVQAAGTDDATARRIITAIEGYERRRNRVGLAR